MTRDKVSRVARFERGPGASLRAARALACFISLAWLSGCIAASEEEATSEPSQAAPLVGESLIVTSTMPTGSSTTTRSGAAPNAGQTPREVTPLAVGSDTLVIANDSAGGDDNPAGGGGPADAPQPGPWQRHRPPPNGPVPDGQ